jgi:hypothetical protein
MKAQDHSSEKKAETAKTTDPRWEPPSDWRTELVFERLDEANEAVSPFAGDEHDRAIGEATLTALFQVVIELDLVRRELAWARKAREEKVGA